jgi:hypothetical protein
MMRTKEEQIQQSKDDAAEFVGMAYERIYALNEKACVHLKIMLADYMIERERLIRREAIADFREAIRKVEQE